MGTMTDFDETMCELNLYQIRSQVAQETPDKAALKV